MIIGITGTFGSGKTTVANMFKKYGFKVINVDKLYHNIYNKNKKIRDKIKKEFGTLNRNQLKKIVFNDYNKREISKKISGVHKDKLYEQLKKLNRITHPLIIDAIKKQIYNNAKIVIDAPLLIEAKAQNLVSKVIVVRCNKKEQIKRALKKKKYQKKEIEQIIKSQMPLKEKIKYADFVVDNSGTIKETKQKIAKIIFCLSHL